MSSPDRVTPACDRTSTASRTVCRVRVIDSPLLSSTLGIIILMSLCYACGRVHQWYKTTLDREIAFREGYNTATQSLFSLATRATRHMIRPTAAGTATVKPPIRAAAAVAADDPSLNRTTNDLGSRARHRARSKSLSETRIWPRTFV